MVLVNMRDPEFVEELSNLSPYLPQFLFKILAQLAEGNRQHYPVKKLLLLLWKILMTIVGSDADLAAKKSEARKLYNLPPVDPTAQFVKSVPQEYHNYHLILSHRYPGYFLPDARTHLPNVTQNMVNCSSTYVRKTIAQLYDITSPSYPFQMCQLQPLLFGPGLTVPEPISQAIDVFGQHMYVSTAAVQISLEMDLSANPTSHSDHASELGNLGLATPVTSTPGLPRYEHRRIQTGAPSMTPGLDRMRKLFENLQDNLPKYMNMFVRLMYYLNLASNELPPPGFSLDSPPSSAQLNEMDPEVRTVVLEWLDSMRHREVVTLSICSSMLLLLKAFKRYHILAFEYMSQLLMDNNCAILIVKMLNAWFSNSALDESEGDAGGASNGGIHGGGKKERVIGSTWLKHRCDPKQLNFMDYCRISSFNSSMQPVFLNDTPSGRTSLPNSGMAPSCFRAFSTTITLLRILQKMTKGKPHRVLLLVQWKAAIVLKRIIRINHAGLYLYALKLIKSQVPFLGKKWRPHNLPIVTLIYRHLRPVLVEEYLMGDLDIKSDEVLAQEQQLRALIVSFMARMFPLATAQALDVHGHPIGSDTLHKPTPATASIVSPTSIATTFPISPTGGISTFPSVAPTLTHTGSHSSYVDDLDLVLRLSEKGSFDTSNPYHASLLRLSSSMMRSHDTLDDNFMAHYHEWLESEVYSPQEMFSATRECEIDTDADSFGDDGGSSFEDGAEGEHFYYVINGK
ncbi:hypothetical protein BASA60_004069 [Batrachochytrium salamandrivorans]|nr:hypothetical protein BASA60_004069 [Batrachochytrium salamandrivorans]